MNAFRMGFCLLGSWTCAVPVSLCLRARVTRTKTHSTKDETQWRSGKNMEHHSLPLCALADTVSQRHVNMSRMPYRLVSAGKNEEALNQWLTSDGHYWHSRTHWCGIWHLALSMSASTRLGANRFPSAHSPNHTTPLPRTSVVIVSTMVRPWCNLTIIYTLVFAVLFTQMSNRMSFGVFGKSHRDWSRRSHFATWMLHCLFAHQPFSKWVQRAPAKRFCSITQHVVCVSSETAVAEAEMLEFDGEMFLFMPIHFRNRKWSPCHRFYYELRQADTSLAKSQNGLIPLRIREKRIDFFRSLAFINALQKILFREYTNTNFAFGKVLLVVLRTIAILSL